MWVRFLPGVLTEILIIRDGMAYDGSTTALGAVRPSSTLGIPTIKVFFVELATEGSLIKSY